MRIFVIRYVMSVNALFNLLSMFLRGPKLESRFFIAPVLVEANESAWSKPIQGKILLIYQVSLGFRNLVIFYRVASGPSI